MRTTAVARLRGKLSAEVVVAVVFVSSMFMTVMDITVVNVAIPTIANDFRSSYSGIEWIITGYTLSLALWVPASGWIGDKFGAKKVLLLAIFLFVSGSAACAAADSLGMLIAARVFQGVGGGMMQPVGMALLFRTFPPERRARASQILIIPTAIGPAVGPIVGGFLVEHASWRWLFLINLPVGLVALVFGALFLENEVHHAPGSFDVRGFVLGGAGLPLLLYAISRGPSDGWGSSTVLGIGVAAVVLLALFVRSQLRQDEPLLDLRLLNNRLFLDCILVSVVGFSAFLGMLFIIPLYLQSARGFSPLTSGLTTFTEAIAMMLSTQIAGKLYPRIGPRRLTTGGLLWLGTVFGVGAVVFDHSTSLWVVRIFMFAMGTGIAYIFISQQAASFATIHVDDMGRASALASTIRQASSAAGVALLATVLVMKTGHGARPTSDDFGPVFIAAAVLAFIGAAIALRIRDSDAAATMHPLSIAEEAAGLAVVEMEIDAEPLS